MINGICVILIHHNKFEAMRMIVVILVVMSSDMIGVNDCGNYPLLLCSKNAKKCKTLTLSECDKHI